MSVSTMCWSTSSGVWGNRQCDLCVCVCVCVRARARVLCVRACAWHSVRARMRDSALKRRGSPEQKTGLNLEITES